MISEIRELEMFTSKTIREMIDRIKGGRQWERI